MNEHMNGNLPKVTELRACLYVTENVVLLYSKAIVAQILCYVDPPQSNTSAHLDLSFTSA